VALLPDWPYLALPFLDPPALSGVAVCPGALVLVVCCAVLRWRISVFLAGGALLSFLWLLFGFGSGRLQYLSCSHSLSHSGSESVPWVKEQ
jgi:hypothetical protein